MKMEPRIKANDREFQKTNPSKHPRVVALRRRFAPQLEFLSDRLSPSGICLGPDFLRIGLDEKRGAVSAGVVFPHRIEDR